MATVFNLLRSNDLIWPYIVNVYQKGKEPLPFDLLYWNSNSSACPRQTIASISGTAICRTISPSAAWTSGASELDLNKIDIPIYDLAAREDHIAPAKSVFVGARLFGGKVRFVLAGSGDIAGVINPPDPRSVTNTGPIIHRAGELEGWLKTAQEHPGSWWPDWQSWVEQLDGEKVPARTIGTGKLKPIEEAPGSYVKVKG